MLNLCPLAVFWVKRVYSSFFFLKFQFCKGTRTPAFVCQTETAFALNCGSRRVVRSRFSSFDALNQAASTNAKATTYIKPARVRPRSHVRPFDSCPPGNVGVSTSVWSLAVVLKMFMGVKTRRWNRPRRKTRWLLYVFYNAALVLNAPVLNAIEALK